MKCAMDQGSKSGLITPGMKANGEKIRPMVGVNFGMQMEIYMKENGATIKCMAKEYTHLLTIKLRKGCGNQGKKLESTCSRMIREERNNSLMRMENSSKKLF